VAEPKIAALANEIKHTAMGPERSFNARWTSAIAKALLDCTNDISRRLGFSASARR